MDDSQAAKKDGQPNKKRQRKAYTKRNKKIDKEEEEHSEEPSALPGSIGARQFQAHVGTVTPLDPRIVEHYGKQRLSYTLVLLNRLYQLLGKAATGLDVKSEGVVWLVLWTHWPPRTSPAGSCLTS